jgi:hypothetical protein
MTNSSSNYDYFVTYYKYDINNQLIEKERGEKLKYSKEKIIETIKYQYDENGDCITEEEYDGKVLREKKEHKYINHKLVETFSWQWFEGEDLYVKNLYTYNNDGTLESNTYILYHYNSKNEIASKNTTYYHYTYDDKNRLIEYKKTNTNQNYYNLITTYNNFDKMGNWQLKITNKDGKETKEKRKFDYFDN